MLIYSQTLEEEKLTNLSGDKLEALNKRGYLQDIYMLIASQSKFQELVERKNALIVQTQ